MAVFGSILPLSHFLTRLRSSPRFPPRLLPCSLGIFLCSRLTSTVTCAVAVHDKAGGGAAVRWLHTVGARIAGGLDLAVGAFVTSWGSGRRRGGFSRSTLELSRPPLCSTQSKPPLPSLARIAGSLGSRLTGTRARVGVRRLGAEGNESGLGVAVLARVAVGADGAESRAVAAPPGGVHARVAESVRLFVDELHTPGGEVLLERSGAGEHVLHFGDLGGVPAADILVDRCGGGEHASHVDDVGGLPAADVLVEHSSAVEHALHVGNLGGKSLP